MTAAITVENLGKAYRIGLKDEMPDTLVAAMSSWARMPWRNFQRLRRLNTFSSSRSTNNSQRSTDEDTVWALRDVSFDVQEGEVVGIIGRNGAGKSTLLKILSRITEPTAGRAVIRGRVSSLLEVGTGFHPELSGRENIYMNGTILGMRKREIDRKFDEIVEFSGVEKFLDTPIKRYSSGMKVRLAFSVAAHLEPEILIIDEVLAVGDAAFQEKCLGKMENVAGSGRTVLFVSHNMAAVRRLCRHGLVIDAGRLVGDHPVERAIDEYLTAVSQAARGPVAERTDRGGRGATRVERIVVNGTDTGTVIPSVAAGGRAVFEFWLSEHSMDTSVAFHLTDRNGQRVAALDSRFPAACDRPPAAGSTRLTCTVPEMLLAPGRYTVTVSIYRGGALSDQVEAAALVEVTRGTVRGRAVRTARPGIALLPHEWS